MLWYITNNGTRINLNNLKYYYPNEYEFEKSESYIVQEFGIEFCFGNPDNLLKIIYSSEEERDREVNTLDSLLDPREY